MKTHLNLATTDLAKSVEFYSTLLDAKPSKVLDDYALFITEEPGLELALDLSDSVSLTRDMHFGVYVESAEDVERAETSCYANQTKVWAIDPEGRRWEVYTVHEDTEAREDRETTCCVNGDAGEVSCA